MKNHNTKLKLIEVGMQVILEKGHDAAGLQEILSQADVPKGSFYYYFKSKEDFCISIITHYIEAFTRHNLAVLFDRSVAPRDRLFRFFNQERENYLKKECKEGCLIVRMIIEMPRLCFHMQTELLRGVEIWVNAITDCLEDYSKSCSMKLVQPPREMAAFIQSGWIGALTLMLAYGSVDPLDRFLTYLDKAVV